MWKNLENWTSAVQEGVKEFSTVAIHEVRTGVNQSRQNLLDGAPDGEYGEYNIPNFEMNHHHEREAASRPFHLNGVQNDGLQIQPDVGSPASREHPQRFSLDGPGIQAQKPGTKSASGLASDLDGPGSPSSMPHSNGADAQYAINSRAARTRNPPIPTNSATNGTTHLNEVSPNHIASYPPRHHRTNSNSSLGGATAGAGQVSVSGREDVHSSTEEMKKAYSEMKSAYEDMKGLLKKSMGECERLSEEVIRLEGQMRSAEAGAVDSSAAVQAAKREAADTAAALAATRRDLAAAEKRAAGAEKELEKEKAKAGDNSELEAVRNEVSALVRKAAAAVAAREEAEKRAAAAETARAESESARLEAERLRREAQAEAHAAIAAADADRSSREEAQGLSEALRADSERRARVFNNAVRTAVAKVQAALEAERDELQAHLHSLQATLDSSRAELRAAYDALSEVQEEAAARRADAAAAGNLAASAQESMERALVREAEARAQAQAAVKERNAAQTEAEQLRLQCEELTASLAKMEAHFSQDLADASAAASAANRRISDLERDLQRQSERADSATAALAASEAAAVAAAARLADTEGRMVAAEAAHTRRLEELEAELMQLRASGKVMSLFQLPSKEDVLTGLGLEMWKDDRLRWKNSDVENNSQSATRSPPRPQQRDAVLPTRRGQISLRTWLIITYLLLLHVVVMVSFTRTNDVGKLCHDFATSKVVASVEKAFP